MANSRGTVEELSNSGREAVETRTTPEAAGKRLESRDKAVKGRAAEARANQEQTKSEHRANTEKQQASSRRTTDEQKKNVLHLLSVSRFKPLRFKLRNTKNLGAVCILCLCGAVGRQGRSGQKQGNRGGAAPRGSVSCSFKACGMGMGNKTAHARTIHPQHTQSTTAHT